MNMIMIMIMNMNDCSFLADGKKLRRPACYFYMVEKYSEMASNHPGRVTWLIFSLLFFFFFFFCVDN